MGCRRLHRCVRRTKKRTVIAPARDQESRSESRLLARSNGPIRPPKHSRIPCSGRPPVAAVGVLQVRCPLRPRECYTKTENAVTLPRERSAKRLRRSGPFPRGINLCPHDSPAFVRSPRQPRSTNGAGTSPLQRAPLRVMLPACCSTAPDQPLHRREFDGCSEAPVILTRSVSV